MKGQPTLATEPAVQDRHTGTRSNRPSSLTLLIALALVAAGIGLFIIGSALPTADAEVLGVNRPVNAGASDPLDIRAHNSPTVVRNPQNPENVVVTNRIDTPRFSCALHVSSDGGAAWRETAIPFPAGEELPARCYAPDATFGPDGTLHVSFVTLEGPGNRPHAVWLVSSTDDGRTLTQPTAVAGPLAFGVRLTADPAQDGRLHMTWLQAESTGTLAFPQPGNPIVTARSDDNGATWSQPIRVNPPERTRVVAPSISTSPEGGLFVLYLDVGEDSLDYHGAHEGKGGLPYPGPWSLVLAHSLDDGATWNETVVDDALVPTERFIAFLPPTPALAVDPEGGWIYAAFQDARLGDTDVWLWASDDAGASFASPARVNDTPGRDGTSQYRPKIDVASSGRLDVVYYDRRADLTDALNEVSIQSSVDHGATFGPRLRLSDRAFDSRIGFGSERNLPDLGSRLGLVSDDEQALAVWTDTRFGNEASNKQDLGSAFVAFSSPSPLRTPFQIIGAALVIATLVGLAVPRRLATKPGRRGGLPG